MLCYISDLDFGYHLTGVLSDVDADVDANADADADDRKFI